MRSIRTQIVLSSLLCTALFAQQAQTPPAAAAQQTPTFRTGTEEVLIDVVVRDKKGKPVKELSLADFKISDDGVEQKIKSIRLVDGIEAIEQGARVPLDAMRQIRLVTLVFEQLGDAERAIAKKAALDLVKGDQAQNVFYSVVAITNQLSILQSFTTDKEKLRTAIEKAASGKYLTFPAESDRIKAELKEIAGRSVAVSTATGSVAAPASPAEGTAAGAAAGSAAIEKRTAEIMLEMLQFDGTYSRNEGARISIFALLSLVRGQYSMPGRKNILYFSSGLYVPTHLDEPFRNIMSTANRGNITFYPVDCQGVITWSRNQGATDALNEATRNIKSDTTATDGAVSKEQIMAADRAETAGRSNTQLPIRELGESTGGFLIANANDLRPALRQVNEEVNSYYELTYNPGIQNYDGKFRKTRVEVARKDIVVHARNGYFALPMNVRGPAVSPVEFALLKAIDTTPAPAEVEFRSGTLRLKSTASGADGMLVVEVPMSGIRFTENVAEKTFTSRITLLALVKSDKGEVVKKLSTDLPRKGPLAILSQARAGNFIYTEKFNVPPGRYTVETAVLDHEAGKTGVMKTEFVSEARPAGVGLSSLCLVRNFQANVKDLDPQEPLQFQGGKITPTLSGKIFIAKGAQLSTFFVVQPDPAMKQKPTATIEFLVEGTAVAKADVPLPEPDALGRIAYVMSVPAENLPAAVYEIHLIVKQGDTTAEDRMKVTVAAR